MRRLAAALSLLIFLDAVTTYFVITSGAGYEGNPAFQIFNTQPSLALIMWVPAVLLVASVYGLYRYADMRGFYAAKRVIAVLTLMAAVHRALIVLNNLSVLFFGASFLFSSFLFGVLCIRCF